jgi:NADPH:quinone reductase-like Zn-dependent oxidoreductase
MASMKAAVVHQPGGPEVLKLEERPIPQPQPDWVRIRVHGFGLNRAEIHTRRGESPGVTFPRILGIEATGTIDAAPDSNFTNGETVATVMGGMGRTFDGSYAEYVCVPANQVRRLTTKLDWAKLAALPEMLQTAWGALHRSLQIEPGQTLLIRGGTSSVGLATAALARRAGLTVFATTRNPQRAEFLQRNGVNHVIMDNGAIKDDVHRVAPDGVDRVLDLVGTKTLADSLACVALHGIVCIAGGLGEEWALEKFSPMAVIPGGTYLTTYGSRVDVMLQMPWEELLPEIESGRLNIPLGPVFRFDQIVEAHRCMEQNSALGKIVVLT